MHCPAYVIMMVADVLVPNRHQNISNHHANSAMNRKSISQWHVSYYAAYILRQNHLKNNVWEVRRSATRQFICYWWVRLFILIAFNVSARSGISLGMCPANERRHYIITTALIGWARTVTHWGHVTQICVSKLTIIGSDNGLSPRQCQAIIWTNAGIFLIRILGTNLSEILSRIHTFSFKKMHLKMSSAKSRPFWLGFNVLTDPCKVLTIVTL